MNLLLALILSIRPHIDLMAKDADIPGKKRRLVVVSLKQLVSPGSSQNATFQNWLRRLTPISIRPSSGTLRANTIWIWKKSEKATIWHTYHGNITSNIVAGFGGKVYLTLNLFPR